MDNPEKPWLDAVYMFEGAVSSEARRLTTIQLHGIIATALGVLITLTAPSSGTSLLLFAELDGWPWLAGLLLVAFGAGQLIGSFTPRPRLCWLSAAAVAGWYAWFGVGFIIQWTEWVLGGHVELLEPPIYPVAVYFGLAALQVLNAHAIRERIGMMKQ